MPNLFGSSAAEDIRDFKRLFAEPAFRPDELKIYPCSLIEGTELMERHEKGTWRPYEHNELLGVLTECLTGVPPYCRVSRVIRDIPRTDIVVGNKQTNLREVAEREIRERGLEVRDIRAREIRDQSFDPEELKLVTVPYRTELGTELFLQFVTDTDQIVGFLRLSLPESASPIEEIQRSAMIREIHVYGRALAIGEDAAHKPQHSGLGKRLTNEAARRAADAGFEDLAVISSVGTRGYYRALHFSDGELYQHRRLEPNKQAKPEQQSQA